MTVLGLDIGGANLKGATSDGRHHAVSFPLWKQPERLAAAVREFLDRWSDVERLAITMTGELADCYATKAEGVAHIVGATLSAGHSVQVWTTDGRFVAPETAVQQPMRVAAGNWHALATWVARQHPSDMGLLIDIGSTTTDLIPFRHGVPIAQGRTDLTRLRSGELLYTGVRRTPLCAVRSDIELAGQSIPVAAEWFATMLDVYLWLGDIPEEPDNHETADGRPATRDLAWNRLAHMVCADRNELSSSQISSIAEQFAETQQEQIRSQIAQLCQRLRTLPTVTVTAGAGEFLIDRVLSQCAPDSTGKRWSLSQHLGAGIAECACAYAIAQLAADA